MTFTSYPEDDGTHPRSDTVANDVVRAVAERGYEDVTIVSQDIHPR